jgi:hypothetical protein
MQSREVIEEALIDLKGKTANMNPFFVLYPVTTKNGAIWSVVDGYLTREAALEDISTFDGPQKDQCVVATMEECREHYKIDASWWNLNFEESAVREKLEREKL